MEVPSRVPASVKLEAISMNGDFNNWSGYTAHCQANAGACPAYDEFAEKLNGEDRLTKMWNDGVDRVSGGFSEKMASLKGRLGSWFDNEADKPAGDTLSDREFGHEFLEKFQSGHPISAADMERMEHIVKHTVSLRNLDPSERSNYKAIFAKAEAAENAFRTVESDPVKYGLSARLSNVSEQVANPNEGMVYSQLGA